MSNHFHIYVYLEDEHLVSEEELYGKICRLYCKDTLAGIIDKWKRLKELAAPCRSDLPRLCRRGTGQTETLVVVIVAYTITARKSIVNLRAVI